MDEDGGVRREVGSPCSESAMVGAVVTVVCQRWCAVVVNSGLCLGFAITIFGFAIRAIREVPQASNM